MNFAEARAVWVAFGLDINAAFDYIEALSVLDQLVMMTCGIFDNAERTFPVLTSDRYAPLAHAVGLYAHDTELMVQYRQLKQADGEFPHELC